MIVIMDQDGHCGIPVIVKVLVSAKNPLAHILARLKSTEDENRQFLWVLVKKSLNSLRIVLRDHPRPLSSPVGTLAQSNRSPVLLL